MKTKNQRRARRKRLAAKRPKNGQSVSTYRSTINLVLKEWERRREEKADTARVVETYKSINFAANPEARAWADSIKEVPNGDSTR